mgnify:CR=1 FL=1
MCAVALSRPWRDVRCAHRLVPPRRRVGGGITQPISRTVNHPAPAHQTVLEAVDSTIRRPRGSGESGAGCPQAHLVGPQMAPQGPSRSDWLRFSVSMAPRYGANSGAIAVDRTFVDHRKPLGHKNFQWSRLGDLNPGPTHYETTSHPRGQEGHSMTAAGFTFSRPLEKHPDRWSWG